MNANRIARILVVGAGSRGATYAAIANGLTSAEIRAIAEPRQARLAALADECGVPMNLRFSDWRDLLAARLEADIVIVATQDVDHADPAIAFMEAGYDVLLEKPMAPSRADAERIVAASELTGRRLIIAHVMRYQKYTKALLDIMGRGDIGEVVTLDHLEPIGHLHFSHSYVRGNWRKESIASPALMSKSCHDIDWISAVVGGKAERVSSFGSLFHFREENAPVGSGERCATCAVEATCAFSAKRQYLSYLTNPDETNSFALVIADEMTEEAITHALETGPYGRCVYRCDNDVVDHQVVNIEYSGGRTASFTMSAFNPQGPRRTRIGGTRGFIEGDGEQRITVFDYLSQQTTVYDIDTRFEGVEEIGHHGGGDAGLIRDTVDAIVNDDWSAIPTGARDSLDTHVIVWAAEEARRTNTVVTLGN